MTLPGVELTTALADSQPRRHALRMSPLLDPLFVDSTSGVSGGEVSVVLGAPGVGKSRLAMQWLSWVCRQYGTPGLYVSTDGEMAASQVIELAQALGALDAGIHLEGASISIPHSVWHPDELYSVISSLRSAPVPVPVVVDSLLGLATTWQQERAVRSLKEAAVLGNAAVMLLAGNHAVGSGAGPRSLLHPADAVLRVTLDESDADCRRITVVKNRHGRVPLSALVRHTDSGLVPVLADGSDGAEAGNVAERGFIEALADDVSPLSVHVVEGEVCDGP
ncbi:DNA repair protein RadA [Mycobacteroides abscessus subsp. bolletii]|uniref:RAD55 family ATPase n=2 Tax=Mycobacteroides abscessus TaxID=36809 RepID=UPI0005E14309|nr:ATPase domain-containing protein [Mycobacteroides abscessus]CPW51219.1 DNA repair protein RadA [Mycobacteroides abscessus]SKF49407.1 DNA repair protein RadA [Mycobacteroides abscessus subsp. bolletii]SKH11213.1 DNA repair protein RadA [Mycobacteroides abscessus subsp. bolletii]SKU75304.1 DNA repair protein RadA [Mycobacteroides abscessus subsp. bolletii]